MVVRKPRNEYVTESRFRDNPDDEMPRCVRGSVPLASALAWMLSGACTYDYDSFSSPSAATSTSSSSSTGASGGFPSTGGGGAGATGAGGVGGTSCDNHALSFDGADDFVHISGNNVYDALASFTVEAWISPDTDGFEEDEWQIVSDHDHNALVGWVLLLNGGKLELRIYDGNWNTLSGSISMRAGEWHHVAGTLDDGVARVFFDGDELDEQDLDTVASAHAGPTRIGAAAYVDNFHFSGLIDEVRISSVARYADDFTPPNAAFTDDPATISLFQFEEASDSQQVTDAGGNVVARLGLDGRVAPDDPARLDVPCVERF
jgi:hypothetical protein